MLKSLKVLRNLCLPNVYRGKLRVSLPALSIQLDPFSSPLLLCTGHFLQPLTRRRRHRASFITSILCNRRPPSAALVPSPFELSGGRVQPHPVCEGGCKYRRTIPGNHFWSISVPASLVDVRESVRLYRRFSFLFQRSLKKKRMSWWKERIFMCMWHAYTHVHINIYEFQMF